MSDPAPITATVEVTKTGEAKLVRAPGALPIPAVALQHQYSIDGATYIGLIRGVDEQLATTGLDAVGAHIAAMGPANPAERMLAVQMLWQHARIARLMRVWQKTDRVDHLKALDTALDAALGVYRKQAETWANLKNPRPQIGKQINMANQQIVNPPPANPALPSAASNEQGCPDGQTHTPALPAQCDGAGVLEDFGLNRPALVPVHRTPDPRGQGPLQP